MRLYRNMLMLILCLCMVFSRIPAVMASGTVPVEQTGEAEDISGLDLVTRSNGFPGLNFLFNKSVYDIKYVQENAALTLEYGQGIGSLYLIFHSPCGTYTVTDNKTGVTHTFGEQGYVHDWLDLEGTFGTCLTSLTLQFTGGPAWLAELYVFTGGEAPDFVQRWETLEPNQTDLMLFSAHGDDDQLFFAGLLPYYVMDREYRVMVVYMTDHSNDTPFRIHEMLNGLWAVGIRAYPVFGPFPDFIVGNTMEGAFQIYAEMGWTRDEMTGFVVEQLRRFKPLVAVGHDFEGEYGHVMHMAYAQMVAEAVEISNDPARFPESAEKYGVWDVPKTYVHLYPENEIVMDFDQPMEKYGGITPYQVSKEWGFPCHLSQYGNWLWYLKPSDTAAGLEKYNPCCYGLYRSTVGTDTQKQDMFENLLSYSEQAALAAQEEAERQEEERLKAEAEAQRLDAEAEKRKEEAHRQTEEAARLTEEQRPAGEAAWQRRLIIVLTVGSFALAVPMAILVIRRKRR